MMTTMMMTTMTMMIQVLSVKYWCHSKFKKDVLQGSVPGALGHLEEVGDVLLRRALLDAVSEVHDVPDALVLSSLDGLQDPLGDEILVSEEDASVHVALVRELVASRALDSLAKVDRVTEGDDVGVALGHALDEGARVRDIEDDGQVRALLLGLLDNVAEVRSREDIKITRGELGGPRIKDLDGLLFSLRVENVGVSV